MIAPLAALLRLHEINVEASKRGGRTAVERSEVHRLLQALTPHLLQRYEELFRRHGEDAIAPLRRGACMGCYTRQPARLPQVDQDVYACEHCGRLIYEPEVAYELYVG